MPISKNKLKLMELSKKHYFETRITTRNIITDWIQGIRNILGLPLHSYEEAIQKTAKEMIKELPEMEWYKIDIEEIQDGAFMIVIYGERR